MNTTKFVMLLLFGVVCANVGAIRQLEGETKETKYNISIPASNGGRAELYITVQTRSFDTSLVNANATRGSGDSKGISNKSNKATGGSGGLDGIANESDFVSASGSVVAVGTNAMAYSSSSAKSQSNLGAAVVPNGFTTNEVGSGTANAYAFGRTG